MMPHLARHMPSPEQTPSRLPGGRLPKGRTPKVKTLIAFSALIMLLFCAFVAYQASKAYEGAILDAKQNAKRLTRILADQVELTFLSVDLTLRRAVERQYFNLMFGGNLPHDIENNFKLWVDETPQIVALMLVNDEGMVEVAANKQGYDTWMDYYATLKDAPAFKLLAEDAEQSVYIGQYRTGQEEYPQLVLMSRRLSKLDGSFGGVIIAALNPRYFSDFFSSVELGAERTMALMLDSGEMLYSSTGADVADDMLFDQVAEAVKAGEGTRQVVTQTRKFDDAIKVYAYAKNRNLPLVTAVVMNEDDFLSNWRKGRIKDISFLVMFTIFGSVLSFFALTMARQIARVEESESAAILASQAKSEFLANMSHELRTPLNAIIGFSEMLAAGYFGPLNDKQKERVQDVNLCGTHLLQLISDILEFSKGEAGKLELKEENVDLSEVAAECMRMVAERARGKGVALETDIAASLPHLYADKRKVRQILLNLLSNAIKFTPAGGKVSTSARIDSHGQMNIAVIDTGIGIAEDDIPVALSVFGQVHRAHNHEGTGLGLPLCKMFAELHGGKLVLTSTVGEGTSVRVLFPASRVIG
jgi:signal transduction histidine kinase